MLFDEHKKTHAEVLKIDLKLDSLLKELKKGDKISVRHIDALIYIDKRLLTVKHYLDEDFIRNTTKGISRYFGAADKTRLDKEFWIETKANWRK